MWQLVCLEHYTTAQKHDKKMQLDVGSEPYLSTAQALCLFISHLRIAAMAKSDSIITQLVIMF